MAKMSNLMIEVEELLRNGNSIDEIVEMVGVPFEWVKQIEFAMDFEEEEE